MTAMLAQEPIIMLPGVRVWLRSEWTDHSRTEQAAVEQLSASDRERYQRLRSPLKRQQLVRSRLWIRQILSLESEQALECSHADGGRPRILDSSGCEILSISLSHSSTIAAVALADHGRRIGIDVEARTESLLTGVAAVALSRREADWLSSLPAASQNAAMLQLWTAKEAIWKTGGGEAGISVTDVELSFSGTVLAVSQPQSWAPGCHVALKCFGSRALASVAAVGATDWKRTESCEFCGSVAELTPKNAPKTLS